MILRNNVEVTKKDIEEEIQLYEEFIDLCDEMELDGIIKTVCGNTEFWYKEDMQKWIEEARSLIRSEG